MAPGGKLDENVFDIQQGVTITLFVRRGGPHSGSVKVAYADLWGSRASKYDELMLKDVSDMEWIQLSPTAPDFFFVPKDFKAKDEYSTALGLGEIYEVWQNGLKTDRDELFFDFENNALRDRMKVFYSRDGGTTSFKKSYRIENSSSYDLLSRRAKTSFDTANIRRCLYRPFDFLWLYYAPGLTSRPAWDVMQHMLAGDNLGLITTRQTAEQWDSLVTTFICGHKSCAAYDINSLFPLYLYPTDVGHQASLFSASTGTGPKGRKPNLSPKFIADMETRLKLKFISDGTGDLKKTVGPEDAFHYMYAVFHSPTYRARYAEFLKIDFPRLPLTRNLELFRTLAAKGQELVSLHLMESPALKHSITRFTGRGDNSVAAGYPKYEDETVWINDEQGFAGVPEDVWEFQVGGYQVCHKWLKDRRGRELSAEDKAHYAKIVVALKETIRLMEEIDEAIPGWPLE